MDFSLKDGVPLQYDEKLEEIEYRRDSSKIKRISTLVQAGTQFIGRQTLDTTNHVGRQYFQPKFWKRKLNKSHNVEILKHIHTEQNGFDRHRDELQKSFRDMQLWNYREVTIPNKQRIKNNNHKRAILKELKRGQEIKDRRDNVDEFLSRRTREIEMKEKKKEEEDRLEKIRYEEHIIDKRARSAAYWKNEAVKYRALAKQVREVKQNEGLLTLSNCATDNCNLTDEKCNEDERYDSKHMANDNNNTNGGINYRAIKNCLVFPTHESSKKYLFDEKGNKIFRANEIKTDFEPNPTVGVFDKKQRTGYELKLISKMDKESQDIENYYRFSTDNKSVIDQKETLYNNLVDRILTRLKLELDQTKTDEKALLATLRTPIKRDPRPHERSAMHMIKIREKQLREEIHELEEKKKMMNRKMTTATSNLKEGLKREVSPLRNIDRNINNDLPIVVGRNIAKAFDKFWYNPEDASNSIILSSQIEVSRSQVDNILKKQRQTGKDSMIIWEKSHYKDVIKQQLNLLENRLARAEKRNNVAKENSIRDRLNQAVLRYFGDECQLDRVILNSSSSPRHNIEVVDAPTNRVLSSFVRIYRLDEQIGNMRTTSLLAEYLRVLNSEQKFVNSGILFGVKSNYDVAPNQSLSKFGTQARLDSRIKKSSVGGMKCFQRFERLTLLEKIKLELQSLKTAHIDEKSKRTTIKPTVFTKENHCSLYNSRINFYKRKHEKFSGLLDKANAVKKSFLVIIGSENQDNILVEDYKVNWIDNKTSLHITHTVKRANTEWDAVGDEIDIELMNMDYFIFRDSKENIYPNKTGKPIKIPSLCNSICVDIKHLPSYVEKERVEMTEEEGRFYDNYFCEAIEDINSRHQIPVNITETDDFYMADNSYNMGWSISERARQMNVSKILLLEMRNHDIKRKAAFKDYIEKIGRINGYKKKINELEASCINKRTELTEILEKREIQQQQQVMLEKHVDTIEMDLNDATVRLSNAVLARERYRKVVRQVEYALDRENQSILKTKNFQDEVELTKQLVSKIIFRNKCHFMNQKKMTASIPEIEHRAILLRQWADESVMALNRVSDSLTMLQFRKSGCFVPTRFGPRKQIHFRQEDTMLCVELFKSGGVSTKMYITMDECLERWKKLREDSRLAMGENEFNIRCFCELERKVRVSECILMGDEENRQRYADYHQSTSIDESNLYLLHRKISFRKAKKVLRTKRFRHKLKERCQDIILQQQEKQEKASDFENSIFLVRRWNEVQLNRRIYKKEKQKLLETIASQQETGLSSAQKKESINRMSQLITKEFIDLVVCATLSDIKSEIENQDLKQKDKARKEENFIVPGIEKIDSQSYLQLLNLWLKRKNALAKVIKGTKYDREKKLKPKSFEEINLEIQRKKRETREIEKREKECSFMRQEGRICRDVYNMMLEIKLIERQNMGTEETKLRLFYESERITKLDEDSRSSHYNNLFASKSSSSVFKESRRTQLKQGAAKRQKIQKELCLMEKEDKLSTLFHEMERRQQHLDILRSEMEALQVNCFSATINRELCRDSFPVQFADEDRYIEECNEALVALASLELDWMEREEDARLCEEQLQIKKKELRNMEIESVMLCRNELSLIARLSELNKALNKCKVESENNTEFRIKQQTHKKNIHNELIGAEFKESWMDSSVLTKFAQRWPTAILRKQLHQEYMKRLIDLIIFRAEMRPLNQKANESSQIVSCIQSDILIKKNNMKTLREQYARNELLCLRRSKLGRKMFRKQQEDTLCEAFKFWSQNVAWRCNSRRMFKLKEAGLFNHYMMKQFMDRKENMQILERVHDCEKTIMENHTSREIICRRCQKHYNEDHNMLGACLYHPGKFNEKCQKEGGKWSCCQREEISTSGCTKGYHLPPLEGHLPYVEIIQRFDDEEKQTKKEVLDRLINTKNTMHKEKILKQQQLQGISRQLKAKRDKIRRFENIKIQ